MSPTTNAIEPRLALWGAFDVADFADHLAPRIFAHEMKRRLGCADVQVFSPLGYLHPLPFDGGRIVEPLGEWSAERITELARGIDLVAIGNGEIIHTHDDSYALVYDTSVEEARRLQPSRYFIEGLGPILEESHFVAWHAVGLPFEPDDPAVARIRDAARNRAYIAVHDELSRERLLRAGVEREISVVPDVAFVAARTFAEDTLERRLAYLRGIGAYPPSEPPIVVQGGRRLLPDVDEIAGAVAAVAAASSAPILVLETGSAHGDSEFADAVAARLSGAFYRMPASAIAADIVAAITNARCFIGDSLAGNAIAFARGLPTVVLDLSGATPALAEFATVVRSEDTLVCAHADLLPALQRALSETAAWDGFAEIASRIDAHFDALGALAERAAQGRNERGHAGAAFSSTPAASRLRDDPTALRRAFDARGRRLVEQRLRLADTIEHLEAVLGEKEAEIERLEKVAQSLLDSRWFRYTAPLRAIGRTRRPKR
jgi:hypothetical protein